MNYRSKSLNCSIQEYNVRFQQIMFDEMLVVINQIWGDSVTNLRNYYKLTARDLERELRVRTLHLQTLNRATELAQKQKEEEAEKKRLNEERNILENLKKQLG